MGATTIRRDIQRLAAIDNSAPVQAFARDVERASTRSRYSSILWQAAQKLKAGHTLSGPEVEALKRSGLLQEYLNAQNPSRQTKTKETRTMAAKKKAAKKAAKKPPTAKQIAAREKFAQRSKAGTLRKPKAGKKGKKASKKRLPVSSKKIGTAASGPEKAMANFAMKETLRANAAERELAALKEKDAKPKRKTRKKTAKKAAKKHTTHAAPKAAKRTTKKRTARRASAPAALGTGRSLRATAFTVGTGRRTKVYKTWTCFGEKRTGCGGGSDGGHVLGDRRKYKAVRYR